MSADNTAIIVPGHGTYFVADADATFPANPLEAFSLTGAPPAGWSSIGHTSKDNTAAFSKDGGDATTLDTWLQDGVRTIYASTAWSLGINALQLDQLGLDLAFSGQFDTDGGYIIAGTNNGQDGQGFLLAQDGTGKLGFWIPNTNTVLGDAPSIDPTKFLELPLAVAINAAPEDNIPGLPDGRAGIMKLYKSGLVQPVPTIASTTPATTAGSNVPVEIVGRGFTGVTGADGVVFGTTNVGTSNYFVIDDEHIVAVMPASIATGSAPIKVKNGTGISAPYPFAKS
jgi:hypothetical protein